MLTIKQGAELVGKSPDTIRRLIKKNKSSSGVVLDKVKGYLIDRDWLLQQFKPHTGSTASDNSKDEPEPTPASDYSSNPILEALVNQLHEKDQQINRLQETILQKEANTTKLQDQFQQLLARQLPSGSENPKETPSFTQDTREASEAEILRKPKTVTKKPRATKQVTKRKNTPAKSKPEPGVEETKPKRWWSRRG